LVVSTSGGIIADKEEQELFVEVARDITLALHDMESEEAREQAETQLVEQLDELRRWHAVTLGRETRVLDLKHEVNELLARAGQPPRYPSAEEEDE
jgi:GAF domain-containing protein